MVGGGFFLLYSHINKITINSFEGDSAHDLWLVAGYIQLYEIFISLEFRNPFLTRHDTYYHKIFFNNYSIITVFACFIYIFWIIICSCCPSTNQKLSVSLVGSTNSFFVLFLKKYSSF